MPDVVPCLAVAPRVATAGQLPHPVALWVAAAGQLPIPLLRSPELWPLASFPVLLLYSPGLWPLASFLFVTVPFVATVPPFAFWSGVQLTPSSAHQACLGRGGWGLIGGVLGHPDKGVGSGTRPFVLGN